MKAPGPPRYVVGDDGRKHIEYDLVITNSFPVDVTLKSLVVRARGRKLLTLTDGALAAHTHQPGRSEPPTRTIPGTSSVVTLVDIVLPRRREVPKRLSNNVRYAIAPSPINPVIGSFKVHGQRLRVARSKPTVISPPLRGAGWSNANGCCAPDTPHRSAIVSANGSFVTFETFAIDWLRIRGGVWFHGAGTEVGDYVAYGAKIHSVADGRVVAVANHRPEEPINSDPIAPGIDSPDQFAGNNAVVKIAPGKYAVYGHMQPGSVRVKKGQRVRTGQVLGLLGNSGNTSTPHLHFSIQDGPQPFTSTSLPYVFDRFRFQGRASPGATPPQLTVSGTPHRERGTYPLYRAVADFSR